MVLMAATVLQPAEAQNQPQNQDRSRSQPGLLASAETPGLAASGKRPAKILRGRAVAFNQAGSVWDIGWQKVRAQLDQEPGVELDFFTRGERGGEEQMMHDLRRGRAHMGGMSLQGLASTVPELNIAMAPYLFSSPEEVDFVYDNYLFELFDRLFAAKNLTLMQWMEVGWNGIYSRTPIRLPEDAQGLKLRGSPNLAAQSFLAALGADSIPLSSSDLVPSLQTGLIEGGVSAVVFHYFVTRRYATYLTLTHHSYDTGAVVVNKEWFDSASPQQRQAIRAAWGDSSDARAAVRSMVAGALEEMRAEGIQIITPEPRELVRWRRSTESVVDEMAMNLGEDAVEVLAAIRAGKRDFARRSNNSLGSPGSSGSFRSPGRGMEPGP